MAKRKKTPYGGIAVTIITVIVGNVQKGPPRVIIVSGFLLAALLLFRWLLGTDWASKCTGFVRVIRVGFGLVGISAALLLLGWWSWPEVVKPVVHITQFSPSRECRSGHCKVFVAIDVEDTTTEQAWRVTNATGIRIIPFPAHNAAAKMESYLFSELARDAILADMASQLTLQEGVQYRFYAESDEIPLVGTQGQLGVGDLDAGRASSLLAGVIKYKDQRGCVYKTEFCGFWRGGPGNNEMNPCPNGHNEEGIRTNDECTP
jgi:hypothetical protein